MVQRKSAKISRNKKTPDTSAGKKRKRKQEPDEEERPPKKQSADETLHFLHPSIYTNWIHPGLLDGSGLLKDGDNLPHSSGNLKIPTVFPVLEDPDLPHVTVTVPLIDTTKKSHIPRIDYSVLAKRDPEISDALN